MEIENNNMKQAVWYKLDRDVLGEIMSRLGAVDQARFRAVSGACRAAQPTKSLSLPWLVRVDCALQTSTITVELYDPSSTPGTPTLVRRISLAKSGIPISDRTRIKTTYTNGWLFMSIKEIIRDTITCRKYFLVYSPLTKQLFQFPPYDSVDDKLYVVTSSTDPSSPDCIFFVSETYKVPNKCIIGTIRHGDKEWTLREFDRVSLDFVPCVPSITMYIEGIFYLVSPIGQLISYNIISGEFKYVNTSICNDFVEDLRHYYRKIVAFMLNGEFMLMYFGVYVYDKDKKRSPTKPCLRRYDSSTKVWTPVRSLGDKTLFVSQKCWGIATIDKGAQQEDHGVLPNKIYYFFYAGCIIYSFENDNLVKFKYYPRTREEIIATDFRSSSDLLEFKYNSAFRYWDGKKAFFWFDPPVINTK